MTRKPISMRYLASDVPPVAVVIVNALQYVAVTSSFLVFPLIVGREAHLPPHQADGLIGWSMLVLALGTTLQALPRGPVGSGYLAPSTLSAIYLGPCLAAVRIGGLALMAGMTIFGGAVQAVFSRSLNRLRKVLPPELAGTVIFLVGISNSLVGLRNLLQPAGGAVPGLPEWIVAGITLGVMVAANIWSRGVLGLSCALFGIVAGYIAAIGVGVLPLERLAELGSLPIIAPPSVEQIGWSFDATLMLPFAVAAVANGVKAAGLLTASQRLLDTDWVRPDMAPISRGVLSDGIAVAVAGLCAVFPVNISASSVGLTASTGVASRRVAFATSACFAVFALFPWVTRLLELMPFPVVGATLVFTGCAIMKGGIETIAARMYDSRKTLAVGLSITAGLGVEAYPQAFHALPAMLQPFMVSSLVFGTTVGFLLNLLFQIGLQRRETLEIDPAAADGEAVAGFIEAFGARWGARRDVVLRAEWAVQELVDTIAATCAPSGKLTLSVGFDEFNLDVRVRYAGEEFPIVRERPTPDEIADHPDGLRRLSAFLLKGRATHVSTSRRDAFCTVRLQFEH